MPALDRSVAEDSTKVGQLINNVAETLNGKFMESRGMRNPHMREKKREEERQPEQEETKEEKVRRMEAELKPLKKQRVEDGGYLGL